MMSVWKLLTLRMIKSQGAEKIPRPLTAETDWLHASLPLVERSTDICVIL